MATISATRHRAPREEAESVPDRGSLYWCCADVLVLATELSGAALPAAQTLRDRILAVLDRMVATARAERVADAEIAEARYAIVALIDEQILKSSWQGRAEWMNQPLQYQLYREFTAGENFFKRMRVLLESGAAPQALEIYYICLALGFRGAGAGGDPSALTHLVDTAKEQVARRLVSASKVSPHARPRDRAAAEQRSRLPLILTLVGCALLAAGALIGFGWSASAEVKALVASLPRPALGGRQVGAVGAPGVVGR